MMRSFLAAIALGLVLHAMPAWGRPHHRHARAIAFGQPPQCYGIPWCGCWLRLRYGIADRRFDSAVTWFRFGRPIGFCAVGAVAVKPHHVGEVTACLGNGQMRMISGNDGHAVRDRVRPMTGFSFRLR